MKIKTGDLVMVVRPTRCCNKNGSGGIVFSVLAVSFRSSRCRGCGTIRENDCHVQDPRDLLWVDAYRVKRIPPLGELDDVKRDEEITA